MSASNVDTIRRLWQAFERGGIDAIVEQVSPDAEWCPAGAGGRVLRGADELREQWTALRATGVEVHARMDALEEVAGGTVLARGSLRVERWGSLSESTMVWAHHLQDGRVRRTQAFHSRAEALAALARTTG